MTIYLKRNYIFILSALSFSFCVFLNILPYYGLHKGINSANKIYYSFDIIEKYVSLIAQLESIRNPKKNIDINFTKIKIAEIHATLLQLDTLFNNDINPEKSIVGLNLEIKKQFNLATQNNMGNQLNYNNLLAVAPAIIAKASQIITSESQLIAQRNSERLAHRKNIIKYIVIGNVFSLGLIFICFYFFLKEITVRRAIEEKMKKTSVELERLAYFDSLTGLANRVQLSQYLNNVIQIANKLKTKLALVFIDIDHFKNINDTFGHDIGDLLLKEIANHLTSLVGKNDFVARLSGDEFLIILNDFHLYDDQQKIINNILKSFHTDFTIDHHKIMISASIGISVYPFDGNDAGTLLKNADIAMYQAKEFGKNNFQFCTDDTVKKVKKHTKIDFHLRKAIAHNEFTLEYQPKLSLTHGNISGVEGLLRWQNPHVGAIDPSEFISVAENNGLIIPIGEWILTTACKQGVQWLSNELPPFTIAINYSIRQFNAVDFVKSIEKIITQENFNPTFLEFEITENIVIDHSKRNIEIIHALKKLGIKITIDDFGTKYSSLNYLKHFEIDKLKIDHSFIRDIGKNNYNPSIVKAIIAMAHSLGIIVIAEGVETKAQVEFLKNLNCDEIQGFIYSRSLHGDDVGDFLTGKRASALDY